jgi:hypothetical protein
VEGVDVIFTEALTPRRIARSLVTVLALTLVQSVVPTIAIPEIVTPKAEAVTGTVTASSGGSGQTIQIPTGVFSVTFTVVGGAGGKGGDDSNIGKNGTVAGRTIITIAVTPGDVIGLYPGNAGTAAGACLSNAPGGAAGSDNFPGGAYSINGTYFQGIDFSGGAGGNAGAGGCSGAGGGAGAASVATVNSEIVAIAGGAGGGGGTGSGDNYAQDWNGTRQNNGTSFFGEVGVSTVTCTGSNQNSDGGGGGGGGGGYYGGKGGLAPKINAECAGISGSPGGNYVVSRATSVTNDLIAHSATGYVTYDYNVQATTACTKSTTTVDIYTVESISFTGNCTWTVPSTVNVIDFFIVGGGGGGGGDGGSGGGGGAALSRTAVVVTPNSNLTLKSGGGGAGGSWGYSWGPIAGESTTITLASGTVFSAAGGSAGTSAPGSGSAAGGVAVNGGFAGGAGGTSPSCFNVGGAGKTGISTYFLGTLSSYGGGGGGGACPNSAATTPAAGANGGGAGGYAVSSSLNAPGSNATPGSGSGGGGGLATGSGLKINGGKGGSGVILIRYATNAADAFPLSLAASVSARYSPSDLQVLDLTRKGWIDSSGNTASVADAAITGTPSLTTRGTTDGANSTQSSKTLLVAKGGTGVKINLLTLPTDYTMFHLTRYVTGGATGRIISANAGNFLSGHYSGTYKCAHHQTWLTPSQCSSAGAYRWLLSTDQLRYYRADGVDATLEPNDASYLANQALPGGVTGINNYWNGESSAWEVADMIFFNRRLSHSEIILMENWIARVNGLTIERPSTNSELDTAGVFSGQFYKGFYRNDFVVNDTFTVQSWVKPATSCATGICAIFSSENVLVTKIDNGVFQFALDGTTSRWVWVNTGVKVASNEWHHIAMTKKFIGNQANSVEIHLDGQLAYTHVGNPYTGGATASGSTSDVVRAPTDYYYIGARSDNTRFSGAIDELKFWSVARTGAEIASDMHSNATSSPNLSLYYDFNSSTLSNSSDLQNIAQFGPGRSYMKAVTNMVFEDVKVTSTLGPYTTITFPRTYITQTGGWKVPESVTAASTIVVGGGGGAGKSDSKNEYPAGAGGGGGVTYVPVQAFNPSSFIPVTVGAGGRGATVKANDASDRNGQSSYLGVGAGLTALGGGGGGSNNNPGAGGSTVATGGGGGGSRTAGSCAALGSSGGTVPSGYNGAQGGWGWGGLGGSARGAATTSGCYGIPGDGFIDPVTNVEYGHTGSNQFHSTWSVDANYTTPNNGWGGSVSYGSTAIASGAGISGSAGAVIIRYITATRPTYTKPTTAYLNVGMTETFTTNVAQDSATAMLTRTFKWESTTAGSGGTFTTIKQGTGANNAFFSWVPTDTSTTGSNYLYRLTVTDSDTAGLFITDSSTVFAVINGALSMTGINTIKKTINVARSDTYTVFAGTSTYRYSLSPIIPGITLDSTTAMSPVLRISDTATVGTYLETITVTDSVSATFSIPLTITISAPPSLTAGGEVVKNGQVLNLDASNRWGVLGIDGVATNSLPWNDMSGNKKNAITSNATSTDTVGTLCKAPTFSNDFGGHFTFNGTDTCYYTPYLGSQFTSAYTIEAWIRPSSGTIPNGTQILSQMYNTAGEQISLTIGDLDQNTGKIYVGFYSGNGWRFANFPITPIANTWMHITGTYDGTTLRTFLNGALLGSATYSLYGTLNTKGYFIGKRWDSTYFYTGSIAEVRAYNVSLSDSQVALNFNATKDRFDSSSQRILKPTQKYGALNIETFTVTSGGDTKTVTLATGNRTGITWDTASIPGQVKLSVQESLTPGTYYDTITVTDNFSQSTSLPITFTVTKADTITVTAGVATTQVFNNQQATSLPAFGISGLVSSDTATFTQKYTGIDWTKPCSQGGGCEVGDTGPGGGTIFYISPTAINSASGISTGGRYLEVAPINWSGLSVESTTAWARAATSVTGTLSAIGAGAENTRLINNALTTNSVAAKVAADLTFGTKSDWFLPSTLELKEMYDALYAPSLAGNLSIRNYWSSTQDPTLSSRADTYWFGDGGLVSPTDKLGTAITLRPIRAYSPDTITVTTVPTFVDSYTVSVDTITMTSGLLSSYQAVVFQRSGLDITQARQDSLRVNTYGATLGLPFTVTILGGSGSGARTQTVVAGSTATGCAISGDTMTSTSAGACNLQIKKAYSRNYLTETTTATVFFLLWVINQPAPAVGSGPNIALSGESDVTVDIDLAPMISSLSTYAATAGVTSLLINGVGFNGSDPLFELKFWRGITGTGYTINPAKTQITVTVPAGTRTGKVTVITSKGLAVSEFALVVTP